MARPQGEIRQALASAVERLVRERGLVVDGRAVDGITYVDAAKAALVGFNSARVTLNNMSRAGEVAIIGRQRAANTPHWLAVYVPADLAGGASPTE